MLTKDNESQFRESMESFMKFFNKQVTEFDIGVWWSALKRFDMLDIRRAMAEYSSTTTSHMTPKPAAVKALIRAPEDKREHEPHQLQARPEIETIIQNNGLRRRAGEDEPAYRNRMRAYIREKAGGGFLPDRIMKDELMDALE